MNRKQLRKIFSDTYYTRLSGTPEELKTAEYLAECCRAYGAKAWLEPFDVDMADIESASLTADGVSIPCKGYRLSGCGSVTAPFAYLPSLDPASLAQVRGKIVMIDGYLGIFAYKDIAEAGAAGFITYDGNVHYKDSDIDQRTLRPYVSNGVKTLGVNIHAKDAAKLVRQAPAEVTISIQQKEYVSQSHNVVAEIPGCSDEWIVFTAHYDTTSLSLGPWDNMSGCVGLLGIMEALSKEAPLRYGLRFIFCGSEESGLLGSKEYAAKHESELEKVALNINLDMIGCTMGKFIAVVSAEEKLVDFIKYYCSIEGWGIQARLGVYSSDSTPFADKGVPALSFARIATPNQATIHNRYDTMAVMSMEQMQKDIEFLAGFSMTMANAVKCPVGREMPEKIKTELDEYLGRKRKE